MAGAHWQRLETIELISEFTIMLSAVNRAKYAEILTWLMIETMLLVIGKMMEKQFVEEGENDARDKNTIS